MRDKSFAVWMTLSIIIPAPLALLAIGMCGVGHGDCRLLITFPVLFPYALLSGNLFKDSFGLFVVPALVQFPLYVIILRSARARSRLRPAALAILAAHALASMLSLLTWL